MQKFIVDTQKTLLSAVTGVYKTGRFLSLSKPFVGLDFLLSKIAEGIIKGGVKGLPKVFSVGFLGDDTLSGHKFFVCLHNGDLVFVNLQVPDAFVRRGDLRFLAISKVPSFSVSIEFVRELPVPVSDLTKLYRLSTSEYAHFPILDEVQRRIVHTEDEHMLVQGVAGSGKTNVCIDKIVYSSLRGYAGKVLYSTYSRVLLNDTRLKVNEFSGDVKRLAAAVESGSVSFVGEPVDAIEKRLGIALTGINSSDNRAIASKLNSVANFLDTRVDYLLLEDLYKLHVGSEPQLASELYFTKTYTKDIKNHQLAAKLSKVNYLSGEVLYKEIFGLLGGACDAKQPQKMLTQHEYTTLREGSFTRAECETIYSVSRDYFVHLSQKGLTDNNFISRELLAAVNKISAYSLVVLDEVQDFTQVNLFLFKSISRKMFCVGDALQMINASYFSFSYLKRLLYERDISSSAELVSNYRNSKKIADISENLGKLNAKFFGVHSFLLKSNSLDEYPHSEAAYVAKEDLVSALSKERFNNYTVVVASVKEKELLREKLTTQEILTVSEIKGLERDTIVLYNLLTSSENQWGNFARKQIDRKSADENSVYRYYFNLLYVGISRARQKLYVAESGKVDLFSDFFKSNFAALSAKGAIENLLKDADKLELEQDELLERIGQFIKLGQYDNARFSAKQIILEVERVKELARIDVAEQFISKGLYREAGIRFLQLAMYFEAKEQFLLVNDEPLANLADSCLGGGAQSGLEVLDFLIELGENKEVRDIIFSLVENDLKNMQDTCKQLARIKKKL